MDRREKLLEAVCGKDLEGNSVRYADATIKLILGDMGKYFVKFWNEEGPGVMVFQPNNKQRRRLIHKQVLVISSTIMKECAILLLITMKLLHNEPASK